MNRKNTYLKALIIFYLLTLSHIIDAQYKGTDTTIDCNCHLYNLYITQEIEKWPETIHKLKTIYQKEKSDHALFNLVFAQFGYVGYLLNDGYKKEASPYVKAIQKNLD